MTTSNIDDLFRLVTIDVKSKKKVSISLKDKDGDELPVKETIEKLTEYVMDKMKAEETNVCQKQIFPLMAQAVVGGLSKLLGNQYSINLLTEEDVRYSLISMMTVSFYLLKWIQGKGIKIFTVEEDISQDEIDMYHRINRAADISMKAANAGIDPVEIIKQMIRNGLLKKEDLGTMDLGDTEPTINKNDYN